jgi:hypothetical protein
MTYMRIIFVEKNEKRAHILLEGEHGVHDMIALEPTVVLGAKSYGERLLGRNSGRAQHYF